MFAKNHIFGFTIKMKKYIAFYLMALSLSLGCQNNHRIKLRVPQNLQGLVIGDSVLDNNIKSPQELIQLVVRDNETKFRVCGIVKSVGKTGVWLTLNSNSNKEIMATFADPNLVLPKLMIGKEVVLDGEAELKTLSVAQQKAFALENQTSPEEILRIKKEKEIVSFEAKGLVVLDDKKKSLQVHHLQ